MVTAAQKQMIDSYARLMEEFKARIDWLNATLSGAILLPNPAVQEFSFLQLRIVCELIALGCLTAHGEIPQTQGKRLRDEWNATNILKRLEQLHPDFYPKPVKVKEEIPGYKDLDDITSGFLTKADLIALYGRSADLLHRGSISKLLQRPSPWPKDMKEVNEWTQKIVTLLNHHSIGHIGGQTRMMCVMAKSDEPHRVQVIFAQALSQEDGAARIAAARQAAVRLPGLHPSKPWKPQS